VRLTSRHRRIGLALAVCLLACAPPSAPAQSPSQLGYGETPVVAPAQPVATLRPSAAALQPAAAVPRSGVAAPHGHAGNAGNAGSGPPVASGIAPAGRRTDTDAAALAAVAAPAAAAAAPAPSATLDANGGRLPFTGMDLGAIALAALVLLAAGVGLRRATTAHRRAAP
jgi:hypothetical protein